MWGGGEGEEAFHLLPSLHQEEEKKEEEEEGNEEDVGEGGDEDGMEVEEENEQDDVRSTLLVASQGNLALWHSCVRISF